MRDPELPPMLARVIQDEQNSVQRSKTFFDSAVIVAESSPTAVYRNIIPIASQRRLGPEKVSIQA
jgi:hypothetical protein